MALKKSPDRTKVNKALEQLHVLWSHSNRWMPFNISKNGPSAARVYNHQITSINCNNFYIFEIAVAQ